MALLKKKTTPKRTQVKETLSQERFARVSDIANSGLPTAFMFMLIFDAAVLAIMSFDSTDHFGWLPVGTIAAMAGLIFLVSLGAGFYIFHYHRRVISNPTRTIGLCSLFLMMLILSKIGTLGHKWIYLSVGTAVISSVILTITYNQRFAFGVSIFYAALASLVFQRDYSFELLWTMLAAITACCFSLKEIRTRMKLIEVGAIAAVAVFITAALIGIIEEKKTLEIIQNAGTAAGVTIIVGIMLQGFLSPIEKIFGVVTSLTLLDYSDANQPLLKKLAMDAPGTFSHSLLIGSIAETAAESIGANGLLCRVGAYYHDIGKVNKPSYFIENQQGSASRHDQLSPTMSQLVIIGHVKDGIEIAREFGLPAALRQFIETHHGTTLVQYFYNEARKKQSEKDVPVSESEFRYPGPKPQTREAAIVMLADACESAVRSITEISPTKIESLVHNVAMGRLQDGQFDECDLTLRELSRIEAALSKSLAAYHHGRIKYPDQIAKEKQRENAKAESDQQNAENGSDSDNGRPVENGKSADAENQEKVEENSNAR